MKATQHLIFGFILTLLLALCPPDTAAAAGGNDSIIADLDSREIADLDIHVRRTGPDWSVLWDYVDSLNYREIRLRYADGSIADNIFGRTSTADVSHIADGRTVAHRSFSFTHSDDQLSVRMRLFRGKLLLFAGDGIALDADTALTAFDALPGSKILVRSRRPSLPVRCIPRIRYRLRFDDTPFHDLESLCARLAASRDSIEGIWEYMDSDTDWPAVRLGGNYIFAVLRNPGGFYDLIYLDGMKLNLQYWQPFMVRAHLRPTLFGDNFDVEWLASDRTGIFDSHDVYAQYEHPALLTIAFPAIKSKMRFRRLPLRPRP